MLRTMFIAFGVALAAAALAPASAQNTTGLVLTTCGSPVVAFRANNPGPFTVNTSGQLCITGSISASLGGYNPETFLTPFTATTGGVSSSSFTAGKTIVVSNAGTTNTAYCRLGAASTTAAQPILPGSWFAFTSIAETQVTCATSTSTTTINVAVGTGLPTGAGGGGAGGGGGGAITAAASSYAAGAFSAGAGVDGWDLTQGARSDAVWTSGSGSVIALLKAVAAAAVGANPVNVNGVVTAQTGLTPGVAQTGTIIAGNVDVSSIKGIATDVNSGNKTAGTQRVVIATDQPAFTTPMPATPSAGTAGGATPFKLIAANTNNSTLISTGAHSVYSWQTGNINASTPYYMKFYDKATAPTCGTDTPVKVVLIPPINSGNNGGISVGFNVTLGLGICIVTGIADNDNTAVPAATVIANVDYK